MPELTPVTNPVEVTVARVVLLLDHEPPGVASDRLMDVPTHKLLAPTIEDGTGLTETDLYA